MMIGLPAPFNEPCQNYQIMQEGLYSLAWPKEHGIFTLPSSDPFNGKEVLNMNCFSINLTSKNKKQ